ncbi:lytic transglycosylase domain-containing protein [Phenylobacterium sp.]|uniref:lytic transglycosylase domain-containing protein n=1 Tax=Phenylobacterium sp. TaxID=1871053 RepID=UPI002E376729|nr:lytic transglycosylase domain-containing protein [Phenylobacterium sp.]HEX4709301.1 lytic transglycosylase domain-containing protein [Phenylobacterium sp.]
MTLNKRLRVGVTHVAFAFACSAAIVSAAAPSPARADVPQALSPDDARAYAAAFDATERGDFIDAQMQTAEVKDPSLLGYLSFRELMHPTAHVAAFDELSGWLAKFRDLPVADRIFALASKRKTDPAAEAARPLIALSDGPSAANPTLSEKARRGREAFYAGDTRRALKLASASGDRWIEGLAAYRMRSYGRAQAAFADLARDGECDAWLQSAAAYWAARSADAQNDAKGSARYLQTAARNAETFYGILAARQLKLADQANFAAPDDRVAQLLLAAYTAPAAASSVDLRQFVASDPRAHRAAALAQIGRGSDAIQELRAGMALARTAGEQQNWKALTLAMGTSLADRASPPKGDDLDYPTPDLQPRNGFTLDKALVYALVRQESRFNPQAVSPVGATGLMQLRPEAAAAAAGDDKLKSDMTPLFDPAFNLRVGQDYFTWLLERGVGHDLVRAVAAYNGGPATVAKTAQMLGDNPDSLLLMECLPAQETRMYVQRVLAGYWTYRTMWGKPSPSLDALAAGYKAIDERLDLGQPNGPAPQLAAQALQVRMR